MTVTEAWQISRPGRPGRGSGPGSPPANLSGRRNFKRLIRSTLAASSVPGQLPAFIGLQQVIIHLFLGLQIVADQEQVMPARVASTPASPMGQMALMAPISRSSLAMIP